ncbi:PepSY domain-containing protein [Aurantivibrio plasticivorans]
MPIKPPRIRFILWRWHRRIGILAALFVVWLSITGILLNHTERFSLSDYPLPASMQRSVYGLDVEVVTAFHVSRPGGGKVQIIQLSDDVVLLSERVLGRCDGRLVGVAATDELIVIACRDELLLATEDGQIVERAGEYMGLPTPIGNIGRCGSTLCMSIQGGGLYSLDIDALDWQPASVGQYQPSMVAALEASDANRIISRYTGNSISWERFILDIHSGRIAGTWGVLWMDAMAILFVILGLTGIYMWWVRRRR